MWPERYYYEDDGPATREMCPYCTNFYWDIEAHMADYHGQEVYNDGADAARSTYIISRILKSAIADGYTNFSWADGEAYVALLESM